MKAPVPPEPPSLEEYNAQVRNGIRLNDRFYLRVFPVAYQFRGFHATLMAEPLLLWSWRVR